MTQNELFLPARVWAYRNNSKCFQQECILLSKASYHTKQSQLRMKRLCLLSLIRDAASGMVSRHGRMLHTRYGHALTNEERVQCRLLISCMFPFHKRRIYDTWKPGLLLAYSRSGECEHILCTDIFRNSVYKLNANKPI